MSFNPIVIVGGEPQSIFLELILKTFNSKSNNFKKPIILISSKNVFDENIKKFKKNFRYNLLNTNLANIKKIKLICSISSTLSFLSIKKRYQQIQIYLLQSLLIKL